jgi:hypothetical protein
LAAWLTSSSTAQRAKSENRISTIGRVPIMAAPTAAPMMQASEMGASEIRSGPNSSTRPLYWPKTPPRPRSSPTAHTVASRRISSAMAARDASA